MNKLEQRAPHLTALALAVMPDQHIYYRAKAYWLGDLQLTYERESKDGVERNLSWPEKVALAEKILRRVLTAREAWGDRWSRQQTILVGLRDEVLPTFRPMHFCHFRHPSLDDGYLFCSSFSGRYTASLKLVGDDDSFTAEADSLKEAIEALWASCAAERVIAEVEEGA